MAFGDVIVSMRGLNRRLYAFTTLWLCILFTALPVYGESVEDQFARGMKLLESRAGTQAADLLKQTYTDPIFGPAAYISLAKFYLGAKVYDKAESELRAFQKAYPDSVYNDTAKLLLVDALLGQGNREVIPLLQSALFKASEREKPSLLLKLADFQNSVHTVDEAVAGYRKLYLEYPASIQGLRATERLAEMVTRGKVVKIDYTEAEQNARADRLFAKGRFDLAGEIYASLLQSRLKDAALKVKLGRCRFKARQNQESLRVLKEVLAENPSVNDRSEALYIMSLVYWRLDKEKEFLDTSAQLIAKAPTKLKRKGLFNLAGFYLEKKRYSQAESHYKKLLILHPDAQTRSDIKWRLAWIHYWGRRYASAADLFKQAGAISPGSKLDAAAKYWQARSLMQVGKAKEAEPILKGIVAATPLDYYGGEAERRLKARGISCETPKRSQPFPNLQLTEAQLKNPNVAAAVKLLQHGLYDLAALNMDALPRGIRNSPEMAFLFAKAYYRAGRHARALDILTAGFGGLTTNPPEDAPAEFVEIAFPRVFHAETTSIAQKMSVDPYLVWAIIRQESRYDASAVSPAGALGLMQIMPASAGLVKPNTKPGTKVIEEALDPSKNVRHGVRMLAKNLEVFHGKMIPAIAAYNADIRKVKQWVNRSGKLKPEEFIESIPYAETRQYVKKVLAGYRAYSKVHQKRQTALW